MVNLSNLGFLRGFSHLSKVFGMWVAHCGFMVSSLCFMVGFFIKRFGFKMPFKKP